MEKFNHINSDKDRPRRSGVGKAALVAGALAGSAAEAGAGQDVDSMAQEIKALEHRLEQINDKDPVGQGIDLEAHGVTSGPRPLEAAAEQVVVLERIDEQLATLDQVRSDALVELASSGEAERAIALNELFDELESTLETQRTRLEVVIDAQQAVEEFWDDKIDLLLERVPMTNGEPTTREMVVADPQSYAEQSLLIRNMDPGLWTTMYGDPSDVLAAYKKQSERLAQAVEKQAATWGQINEILKTTNISPEGLDAPAAEVQRYL